jgi:hypothetical protein
MASPLRHAPSTSSVAAQDERASTRTLPAPASDLRGVLTVADIDAWAVAAPAGDRLVYAHVAPPLPSGDHGGARVRALVDAGLLTSFTSRTDDGERDYVARRTAMAWPSAEEAAREDETMRVLSHLRRIVHAGQAMPSNREIARACGLRDKQAASYRLRVLGTEGVIRIEMVRAGGVDQRVVTIVATGRSSGVMR